MLTSFKDRDAWIRDVLADAELSTGERACAVRLALFLNIDQRECAPSYDGIAKALAVSKRTAIRLVAALMERGWLAEPTSHGRARNNFYLMRPYEFRRDNGDRRDTVNGDIADTVEAANGDTADTVETPNGDKSRIPFPPYNPPTPENSEENSEERERDSAGESLSPAMDDQTAIHPGHRPKKESARRKQKEAELDAEFEAFWAAYPRHKDKAAARKAYGKAKAATSAEEILAGAHRYAEERAGEEEKYTKHAAT